MIKIKVEPVEAFNNVTQQFDTLPGGVFRFEHCLLAISKWEAKYCIKFFPAVEKQELTEEQSIDYYACMCLDEGFDKAYITPDLAKILNDYMSESHTATTLPKNQKGGRKQVYTSELIYAYMAVGRIPFECETWEIGRLMMLISCVGILQDPKAGKGKKKGRRATAKSFHEINKARRAATGSSG